MRLGSAGFCVRNALQHNLPRAAFDRRAAGQQIVEDGAETVHVGDGANFVVIRSGLLGCQIAGGAQDHSRSGARGVGVEQARQPEIGDFGNDRRLRFRARVIDR